MKYVSKNRKYSGENILGVKILQIYYLCHKRLCNGLGLHFSHMVYTSGNVGCLKIKENELNNALK